MWILLWLSLLLGPLHTTNSSDIIHTPEEIQHATCKIATKDINASANATITRQLRGVCSTRDLEKRLGHLENVILRELEAIKKLLGSKDNSLINALKAMDPESPVGIQEIDYDEDDDYANEIITKEDYLEKKAILGSPLIPDVDQTKIEESVENLSKGEVSHVLDEENVSNNQFVKHNGTLQTLALGKVFYYYWKIGGVTKILEAEDTPLESPVFDFQGSPVHMKITPHQFGSHYLNIELKGTIINKHRFTIIDQNDSKNDITSQMLANQDNYAKAYKISHSKIETFIGNNSLLIKLLIYEDL